VLPIPERKGSFVLGLYVYNAAGEGVRLANDIPFEKGINQLEVFVI